MQIVYVRGATRWRRCNKPGDVRAFKPSKGWQADAVLLEGHPTTGKPFQSSQWWIREVFNGEAGLKVPKTGEDSL